MPISDLVKKIIAHKYLVAIIIIILLLLTYFYFKKRETLKSGKKKRNRPKFKKRNKTREKLKKDADSSESDTEIDMTPKELYKKVHSNMKNGMSADEFSEAADGINNKVLYIELRQLYNSAKDDDREVTSADYVKLFDKLDIN